MQTTGDGTDARTQGTLRGRHLRSGADDGPLVDDLLGAVGEGLLPLRMEPIPQGTGLEPVSYTTGLEELTVEAFRRKTGRSVAPGERAALDSARKRASDLGLIE